jgi:hypothetical protein
VTAKPRLGVSVAVVLLFFAVSRVVYTAGLDVQFNATTIRNYWQIIDPVLLRGRLAESIFYLHGQPPLFNLFIGIVLKLWPNAYAAVFHAAYIVIGAAFAVSLLALQRRMRVDPRVALALTVLFVVAPATVKYENWLFYTYPVAALLCAAALFLHRHLDSGSPTDGLAFYALLAAVVLTRGIYPVAWFALVAAAVALTAPHLRRITLRAAAAPLALLLLFSLKQLIVFGTLGAGSAFMGPNLATRIRKQADPELVAELVREKRISGALRLPQFRKISLYYKHIGTPKPTGIPLLDTELKSTGAVNTNHIGYLAVSRIQMRDVVYMITHYPMLYVKSFAGTGGYFRPSGDDALASYQHNEPRMRAVSDAWDVLVCGQRNDRGPGWNLIVGLPLLLGFATCLLIRGLRVPAIDLPHEFTLGFALVTTLYTSGLTVALSSGDYNRYRFKVDAFYVLFLGIALSAVVGYVGRKRGAGTARADASPGSLDGLPGTAGKARSKKASSGRPPRPRTSGASRSRGRGSE